MPRAAARSLLATAFFAFMPLAASAQSVLFDGPTDSNNCYPFGCFSSGGRYQQAYLGSAFGSAAVFINSITIFQDEFASNTFRTGDYSIRLNTTNRSLTGLSGTFNDNISGTLTNVFSAALSGAVTGSYTFTLATPFFFDPTGGGNLLMDVVTSNITGTTSGFFDAFFGPSSSRVFATSVSAAGGVQAGYGLRTEFGTTVTPEPMSVILLGTGLVGIAGVAHRRRRKAIEA